jgi:hypothetical protein
MLNKLQVALIRRFARKWLGKDIAPLQTVATHPDVLIPYAKFSIALEQTNLVPAKLKVLGTGSRGQAGGTPFLN